VASREYDIIQFFTIYMAVINSSQNAGWFFSYSPNVANAAASSARIFNIRPKVCKTFPDSPYPPKDTSGLSLEFKDVHFTYPTRDEPVLSGLNLRIEAGQYAALVGASGCGKSTIINLIERFYESKNKDNNKKNRSNSGTILYDDTDITSTDIHTYRSVISLVAQEANLYEGTIRDNIALSVHESAATDEAIQAACVDAHIHDFITSLPEGYNTALGPKGVSLSGGQRQRIALARAMLRRPRLLLLDEATSSLDSESEREVQAAIERAAGAGKQSEGATEKMRVTTILAVAHRLSTIVNADVIFVLGKGGRVVERGSHVELVRRRGVYYQMCQAQALDR
jgi:ATP-binding cassette, subfamily B (MDR/TAP), member 1